MTTTSEEDNYRIRYDEYQPQNALPPNFCNEEPSYIEPRSIDMVEYQANDTSINMVEYHANNTSSKDIINITTSDDDSEEENESILSNTLYSAGMHTSEDNTDGEDDPNLLDTDEDNNERNQINQDIEDNDATEQQNNGTTLQ